VKPAVECVTTGRTRPEWRHRFSSLFTLFIIKTSKGLNNEMCSVIGY
jgi:hypothetical protein